jgi:DNA polymerase phi
MADGLFSRNATDGQKFKGFMVFQTMLAGLADQQDKLECLFSKNFITCLMNQAAKEDRFLHRAATKALKVLESTVASQPASLSVVLKCLLGKNGAYNFDQRTNTKTVDRLLQNINSENEKGCLDIIQRPIAKLKQQEKADAQSTLRTYVDYLSKALNATGSSDPSKGEEVKGGSFGLALQELAHLAYSQPKNVPSELLTESIRNLCRSRLETSFAKLIRRSADFSVFCKAVSAIDSNAVTMDDDIKAAVEDALVRMDKLLKRKSKTDVEESLAQGLAILHAVSIFQLYNEEPDAMEVLQDLAQFSDRLKKGKLKEEGSGSSELLVEILLSMVVQPSSLMREVAQQVFDAFTSQISAEGLELLTGPLASGESTKGQQELFNTEDDAMDVDEDGSSDDEDAGDVEDASDVEIDSDVEFVTLNGAEADDGGSDEDEDGEEEEEDDDDDDEDDEEQQKLADLDDQLGKILNSHRLDKDADAESSDNDEDMSDSEMFALDDKLGEAIKHAVKSRNDTKKQKKDAKQSVVNFKHRILDLLDIYIKNEPLNPLSISLLVPLLRLMRTTSTKPLASRACGVILNHQKNLKKARSNKEEVKLSTVEDLLPSLMEIHEEASKDYSHAYAKAASAASLIVVSFMFAVDRSAIKQVAAVYAKTWSEWVLNEAKVQSSFFLDWYNWSQNQASQPVP